MRLQAALLFLVPAQVVLGEAQVQNAIPKLRPRQLSSLLGALGGMQLPQDLSSMLGSLASSLGTLASPFSGAAMQTKPSKVLDELEPQVRANATRQILLFGPFDFAPADPTKAHAHGGGTATTTFSGGGGGLGLGLGAAPMDPNGQIVMRQLAGFCTDCTVLHGSTYVAHEDGSRVSLADGAYLHHLVIMNPMKRNAADWYVCSENGSPPRRTMMPLTYFLGAGVDESEYYFSTTDGKFDSGYYIPASPTFIMQSEVVNYAPESRKWYVAADYEWVPGNVAGSEGDVSVTDISVTGCETLAAPGYMPPEGAAAYNKSSPDFIMAKDGTILHAMGHLHDGGVAIDLMLNGDMICHSEATYGGKKGTLELSDGDTWQTIAHMSTCRKPIAVKKGDVLTMRSIYDTELHPLREANNGQHMEEMGIYTIFFTERELNAAENLRRSRRL